MSIVHMECDRYFVYSWSQLVLHLVSYGISGLALVKQMVSTPIRQHIFQTVDGGFEEDDATRLSSTSLDAPFFGRVLGVKCHLSVNVVAPHIGMDYALVRGHNRHQVPVCTDMPFLKSRACVQDIPAKQDEAALFHEYLAHCPN